MKRVRITALILALIMICAMLGGCGTYELSCHGSYDGDASTLSYMEKKYGEKFEYLQPWGDSMDGTRDFFAQCESFSEPVRIQIENYKEGNRIIRDNYIAIKYRQEVTALIEECLAAEFDETNLFYEMGVTRNFSVLSETLSADATFEEYLADERAMPSITVEIKESNYTGEKQIENIVALMTEKGLKCSGSFIIIKDDVYGTLTSEDALRDAAYDDDCTVEWITTEHINGDYEIIRQADRIQSLTGSSQTTEVSTEPTPDAVTQYSGTFTVESTGDVILVVLDATTGYSLAVNNTTFAVAKDGVIYSEGFFISGDEFDDYYAQYQELQGGAAADEYTEDGYRYVSLAFDNEYGTQTNFDVIEIGNSAVLIQNSISYESYDEIFHLLSFSLYVSGDETTGAEIEETEGSSEDTSTSTPEPSSDSTLEIYDDVFNNNRRILNDGTEASGHVVVPEGVEEIDAFAFKGNVDITAITLPSTLQIIEVYAFDGCTNLVEVHYAGSADEYATLVIEETGNEAILDAEVTFAQ